MMNITEINDGNLEKTISENSKVILDCYAPWCGPCKMLAPVVAEIAEEYAGKVKVGKVNVDEQPELATAFKVNSIPTVVVIRDGKIADVSVGYRPKEQITAML